MKSMTKEEIITELKAAIKPEEEYFIEDDLIDAINQYPEPFELNSHARLACYTMNKTGVASGSFS